MPGRGRHHEHGAPAAGGERSAGLVEVGEHDRSGCRRRRPGAAKTPSATASCRAADGEEPLVGRRGAAFLDERPAVGGDRDPVVPPQASTRARRGRLRRRRLTGAPASRAARATVACRAAATPAPRSRRPPSRPPGHPARTVPARPAASRARSGSIAARGPSCGPATATTAVEHLASVTGVSSPGRGSAARWRAAAQISSRPSSGGGPHAGVHELAGPGSAGWAGGGPGGRVGGRREVGGPAGRGRRVTDGGCASPSSRERLAAAATTASRNAARTPRAPGPAAPAAVVPPVRYRGSELLGLLVASGEQRRGAEQRLADERLGDVAGQPTRTPASTRASATRNTYAGPLPDRAVTASSCASGSRTTVPTAPEDLLGGGEVARGRPAARRDRGRAAPDERGGVRHGPHDGPVRRRRSTSAIGHPRGERHDERVGGQRLLARRQRVGDVVGLDRHDDDRRVGDRPRRARHDPHVGEPLLEDAAPLRVDLRDRDGASGSQPASGARRRAPPPSGRPRGQPAAPSGHGTGSDRAPVVESANWGLCRPGRRRDSHGLPAPTGAGHGEPEVHEGRPRSGKCGARDRIVPRARPRRLSDRTRAARWAGTTSRRSRRARR